MKVYIVEHGNQYEGYTTYAIYSTQEKAEAYIKNNPDLLRWDETHISEWIIDEDVE